MNDTDQPANEEDCQKPPMEFGWVLKLSLLVFNLGFLLDHSLRWSNLLKGLLNGLVHCILFSFQWSISVLPWSLLIFVLFRWRGWCRWRTALILAPAVLLFASRIANRVTRPPNGTNSLRKHHCLTNPRECIRAQVIRIWRRSNGLHDCCLF